MFRNSSPYNNAAENFSGQVANIIICTHFCTGVSIKISTCLTPQIIIIVSTCPLAAMPGYITSLVGMDADTSLFYAKNKDGSAYVSSPDGLKWSVVDSTVGAGITITAKDVPGNPADSFTDVTDGDYTGELFGGNVTDGDCTGELFGGNVTDVDYTGELFGGNVTDVDYTGELFGGNVTDGNCTGELFGGNVTDGDCTGELFGGNVTDGDCTGELVGGNVTDGDCTGELFGGNVTDGDCTGELAMVKCH